MIGTRGSRPLPSSRRRPGSRSGGVLTPSPGEIPAFAGMTMEGSGPDCRDDGAAGIPPAPAKLDPAPAFPLYSAPHLSGASVLAKRLTLYILIGMVLGIVTGFVLNQAIAPADIKGATDGFTIVTDIFLRLIKMIIAPLVFSTLWWASRIWAIPPRSGGSGRRRWRGSCRRRSCR